MNDLTYYVHKIFVRLHLSVVIFFSGPSGTMTQMHVVLRIEYG